MKKRLTFFANSSLSIIIYKIAYILSALIAINLLIYFAPKNSEWVEMNYSQGIYLKISSLLSNIFGVLPFSLTEFLIIAVAVLVIVTLYVLIRNFSVTNFLKYLLSFLSIISTAMFLFWCLWGINNFRMPVENFLPFEKNKYTVNELERACEILLEKTNNLRELMEEDINGVTTANQDYKKILNSSSDAYDNISEIYNIIPTSGKIKPKPMIFSKVMSMLNYTGMYNPYTAETNINIDEPIFNMPFTACHEIAHLKGFPKENEANFISFLTCINSDDMFFKYSGYLSGLIYCSNALYREAPEAYVKLKNNFSEGIIRDLTYTNEYWNNYKGFIARFGENNNNVFLKHTNQPEGTKSYGLVVDLIISYLMQNEV